MSISRSTVYMIQGHDVVCYARQADGKWSGLIDMLKSGSVHCLLLSTTPIFDSQQAAIDHMETLVKEIRALDVA